jgi:hypothetical protein
LICKGAFSCQLGKILCEVKDVVMTLNQRVQGSIPCAPTMPRELHATGYCCWLGGSSGVACEQLLRRAGDRAERTEYAAVAVFGAEPRAALPAVIKKSAGVGGHCFALREAAMRAGDHGMKNGVSHDF